MDRERAQRRKERGRALLLAAVGLLVVCALAWKGRAYYPLAQRARMLSPLHRSLRSAGLWGHGVGIAATAFMLSNFLYAARKHLPFLKGAGAIRSWLQFHVFVGFMSPLVIAFHAAFQSRNLLATGTASALAVVVGTGIVGRYLYGLVPGAGGVVLEIEELQGTFVRLRDEVEPLLARARDPERLSRLLARSTAPLARRSLAVFLAAWPLEALRSRVDLRSVRSLLPEGRTRSDFRDAYLRLRRLRVQIGFYRPLKRLLSGWRVFHASLAVFLVLVIAAHIGVSLYLGYGLFR